MARIRTIKPGFFRSKTIELLSYEERLTFIGLWTHVDDEGRCEYDPELIKADIWPRSRTVADVAADLVSLNRHALILHYVVTEPSSNPHGSISERSLILITGFSEHQRISRPTKSRLPDPRDGEIRPLTWPDLPEDDLHRVISESTLNTRGGLAADSAQERKGKEGNKEKEVPATPGAFRTATDDLPSVTAQAVVASWVDASTANGVTPSKAQIGQVAKLAKELLTANDPGRVLDAATAAGSKGFVSIDRELTAMAGRQATRSGGQREMLRDAKSGLLLDWT